MNISIAPACKSDLRGMIAIQKEAFAPLYALYRDEGSPYLRGEEEHLRWLARPERYVYKIQVDGILCGGIAAFRRENYEYYLARLYISPKMQGREVGARAIALLEEQLPNARKWTLDFPVDLVANRRCYEKAGYNDTGIREQRNEFLTLALYEKEMPGCNTL